MESTSRPGIVNPDQESQLFQEFSTFLDGQEKSHPGIEKIIEKVMKLS
jgi:hypothetical protein